MSDERYTFEQARIRLEEIATLVRKKDTSLEKSLDLLEEGVRLANICTDLVDHTDLSATAVIEKVGESAQDVGASVDLSGEPKAENLQDERDADDDADVSDAADVPDSDTADVTDEYRDEQHEQAGADATVDDSDESVDADQDDPDDDSRE